MEERRSAARDLALVSGLPHALRQVRSWARRPLAVLAPWIAVALGIGVLLLLLVWLVAELSPPGPERPRGLPFSPAWAPEWQLRHVVLRNLVVLALHATACLAGYIVYAAMRDPSDDPDLLERVTRATARVAFWWVPIATLLSIGTQAWILGGYASTVAAHLHMRTSTLLLTTAPHALPELAAVFLPLAAWLVALRSGRLGELYAATIVSVLVAIPLILGAAWLEVHTWHDRVVAAPVQLPDLDGVAIGTLAREAMDPDFDGRAIHLELGEPIEDGRIVDEEQAIVAARRASAGGAGAVAVVELGVAHQLHEVRRLDGDDTCSRPSGHGRPLELADLEQWRFVRISTSMPGTVVELEVEGIVDADLGIAPERWRASAVLRTLAGARCTSDERADG